MSPQNEDAKIFFCRIGHSLYRQTGNGLAPWLRGTLDLKLSSILSTHSINCMQERESSVSGSVGLSVISNSIKCLLRVVQEDRQNKPFLFLSFLLLN